MMEIKTVDHIIGRRKIVVRRTNIGPDLLETTIPKTDIRENWGWARGLTELRGLKAAHSTAGWKEMLLCMAALMCSEPTARQLLQWYCQTRACERGPRGRD